MQRNTMLRGMMTAGPGSGGGGSAESPPRPAQDLEVSAQRLLALDGLEERLEVPVAKAAGAVALDHLEEERRPVLCRLREDLEQVAVVVAVGKDAQPRQIIVRLVD